ncbi:MAG TPA: D-alanyl-D-alanine carboxypeptidase family protein, partial [Acidimicrobiales bacterium]|nr:D-alanyl-D-alanine carboxypeptidase family protein [Acidimicrobiales bacterium]
MPLRRRLAAALACTGLLAAAPGPDLHPAAAAVAAVQPSNRPLPLDGVENGRVPAGRLITVVAGCRVAREAGPSLALLFRSAAAAGAPVEASDCYRPVADQVEVYALWSSRGASACAARPQFYPDGRPKGTSMHGWGKAVDFAEHG